MQLPILDYAAINITSISTQMKVGISLSELLTANSARSAIVTQLSEKGHCHDFELDHMHPLALLTTRSCT